MAGPRIETLDTVDREFNLRHRFAGTRAVETATGDEPVVIFDGDTQLDRLALDWHSLDKQLELPEGDAALGVVVRGNLVVEKSILNWESDYGPFLYVTGSLVAGDIGVGGSELEIDGDLTVKGTLFGFYNHGRFLVRGDTQAEVIIAEEHLLRFEGALAAKLAVADNFFQVANPSGSKVEHWVGAVSDGKQRLRGLGSEGRAHLRLLDPDIFDWSDWEGLDQEEGSNALDVDNISIDRDKVLGAVKAGRSILRGAKTWPVPLPATIPHSLDVMGVSTAKPAAKKPTKKPAKKAAKKPMKKTSTKKSPARKAAAKKPVARKKTKR